MLLLASESYDGIHIYNTAESEDEPAPHIQPSLRWKKQGAKLYIYPFLPKGRTKSSDQATLEGLDLDFWLGFVSFACITVVRC